MRILIILTGVWMLCMSADGCKKKKDGVYKGRLEIKALCMNYTISIIEGNADSSIVTPNWTDESTNKSYQNVFGLDSRCNFPSSIKEGDPFYFVIDEAQEIGTGMRLESMLAEGAKFGARMFVLTQSLEMMRKIEILKPLVQSLLTNTSTQAFFPLTPMMLTLFEPY